MSGSFASPSSEAQEPAASPAASTAAAKPALLHRILHASSPRPGLDVASHTPSRALRSRAGARRWPRPAGVRESALPPTGGKMPETRGRTPIAPNDSGETLREADALLARRNYPRAIDLLKRTIAASGPKADA